MSKQSAVHAIILAAGHGTRTKHALPKVLQMVAGKPMLHWVVASASEAGCSSVTIVLGKEKDFVEESVRSFSTTPISIAVQPEPLGTADAVRVGLTQSAQQDGHVLVLYADCPSIPSELLRELIKKTLNSNAFAGLVSSELNPPRGYGRLLRNREGKIVAIREDKDCTEEERLIRHVNPGIYCFETAFLRTTLPHLERANAQHEFYLTDVIEKAATSGKLIEVFSHIERLLGVNDLAELARVNQFAYRQIAAMHARSGVLVESLDYAYIDATCKIESNASIGMNVSLRGATSIARGARIDVGCVLENCVVGENAIVKPYTVASGAQIGANAEVGPFAHLRPDTVLHERAKVGNFSEAKNTVIGEGSKVNHLSYVGDGRIGKNVNIGAGTIFCNYNGVSKEITTIGDNVFIGSDSQLIAPITVGEGAYVASGSTLTRDVPKGSLAVARAKQENKEGYASRLLARMKKRT